MEPTKICKNCQKEFSRPTNCSTKDWPLRKFCSRTCKGLFQIGKPNLSKGKARPRVRAKNAAAREYLKCCICKALTKYTKLRTKNHLVRCDRPECIETVRERKNARIRKTHLRMYKLGLRKRIKTTWKNVGRVSPEEILLTPWFMKRGWEGQFHVRTGLSVKRHLPTCFDLDFAHPKKKLYVEIDGTTHRDKKMQDERRDRILKDLGWRGLRVLSSQVQSDIAAVKALIQDFEKSSRANPAEKIS